MLISTPQRRLVIKGNDVCENVFRGKIKLFQCFASHLLTECFPSFAMMFLVCSSSKNGTVHIGQ